MWKRLPQWMNQLAWAYSSILPKSTSHKPNAPSAFTDPQHIHLFFPPNPKQPHTIWNGIPYLAEHPWFSSIPPEQPGKLDTVSYTEALKQIPTAQSIEFSGWGDPLEHPEILHLVTQAVQLNGMVTRIHTHGQGTWDIEGLLASPLDHLIIQTVAHRPSLYSAIVKTRQPLSLFTHREEQIRQLINARKNTQSSEQKKAPLFIELSMVLDRILLEHLPDMIEYGISLGVDGIRFENYIDITTEPPSLQTLYDTQETWDRIWPSIQSYQNDIRLELPPIMPSPHSHKKSEEASGLCHDPHTQVSLSQQLAVRPCSIQWAVPTTDNSIWNHQFWNHSDYSHLRNAHEQASILNRSLSPSSLSTPLPLQCVYCPKNSEHYSPLHHA